MKGATVHVRQVALRPPPRKAAFYDRQGRSPGLRIFLFTAPSRTNQWRLRLSSSLTVAGQRGNFTPFPLRPLRRDPTEITDTSRERNEACQERRLKDSLLCGRWRFLLIRIRLRRGKRRNPLEQDIRITTTEWTRDNTTDPILKPNQGASKPQILSLLR